MQNQDFSIKAFDGITDRTARSKILISESLDAIDAIDSFSEALAQKLAQCAVDYSTDIDEQNSYLRELFNAAEYEGKIKPLVNKYINLIRCKI